MDPMIYIQSDKSSGTGTSPLTGDKDFERFLPGLLLFREDRERRNVEGDLELPSTALFCQIVAKFCIE